MELFDLHCDTLGMGLHRGVDINENDGDIDLVRGGYYAPWVQVYAAWIPDGLSVESARRECDALLDVADRWHSGLSLVALTGEADLKRITQGNYSILAIENGGALSPDKDYLSYLFRRGVRMVSLTWNGDNAWGSGCLGINGGLTIAGRRAVLTMEQQGMIVDVAHLNEIGFWQVDALIDCPYVVSHTASATVYAHPRNLTDQQFCAVRDRGGLVGLTLYPTHLGGESLECIRRHLEHFLSLGGERTLCFGADFDGMSAPVLWNGISIMKSLYQYLQTCGWSTKLLQAVFYTNARDFFARYWSQNTRNEE